MNKKTEIELIERYLDGALAENERLGLEKRLAADPALRAELELQRAMQTHLGDPGERRLRAALADVLQNPQSRTAWRWHVHPGLRLAGLAAAILVLIVAAWWMLRPGPDTQGPPVAEQPLPGGPAPQAELPPTSPLPEKQPPVELPADSRQLAQADPADFVPNPTLDARIGNVRGAGDLDVQIDSPVPDAVFKLQNGMLPLAVRGTVRADSTALLQPLRLFVYSNRPEAWENKKPVFDQLLSPELLDRETYRLQFNQTLRLSPGLYYLVLGQQRGPGQADGYRTLWVGRFSLVAPGKN